MRNDLGKMVAGTFYHHSNLTKPQSTFLFYFRERALPRVTGITPKEATAGGGQNGLSLDQGQTEGNMTMRPGFGNNTRNRRTRLPAWCPRAINIFKLAMHHVTYVQRWTLRAEPRLREFSAWR